MSKSDTQTIKTLYPKKTLLVFHRQRIANHTLHPREGHSSKSMSHLENNYGDGILSRMTVLRYGSVNSADSPILRECRSFQPHVHCAGVQYSIIIRIHLQSLVTCSSHENQSIGLYMLFLFSLNTFM